MIAALRTIFARSRLTKDRKAYAAALAEYRAADARQDTRRMHQATGPLQTAHRAFLAAEIAARPLPHPMPRPGAAPQGN